MKQSHIAIVGAPLLCGLILGLTPGKAQDSFKPANFAGLKMGKDTIADAARRFGKPKTTFRDNAGVTWLYYTDLGPVPGRVEIITKPKSNVINSVNVSPDDLSPEKAKAIFGPAFKLMRYDFDSCLDDGESSPIFESKDGALEFAVHAELGIFIKLGGAKVDFVAYLSKPLGTKKSQCQGKSTNRP